MKKTVISLIILGLISFSGIAADYSLLKPNKHGKVLKIQVKGKNWTYYKLDRKNSLEFSVEGPTKIRFITRLDMQEYKSGEKIDYTIYVKQDGRKTHFTRSAVISKGIEFGNETGGKIGTGEDIHFEIPEGKHIIRLYLGKKDDSVVYIRPLKERRQVSSGSKRVAMNPKKFTSLVKIIVKEREYDYFRVGENDSLQLSIIGPATVKTIARLEYDITMNGERKYRIQVLEDGKLKNTFLLNTVLSEIAVYKEDSANKILSRGEIFFIEVPGGEHIYTFKVLDSGRSAVLKFYIPESALNNVP